MVPGGDTQRETDQGSGVADGLLPAQGPTGERNGRETTEKREMPRLWWVNAFD